MPHLRAGIESALGPLYAVEREVRSVGDCRLFVALELPSGPELVVKVLPVALSVTVNPEVFERELLLLADKLTHPQLVPPRGAGRAGSFVYHTRLFIEGTTLRAALARQGQLPLHRVVGIVRDMLGGLAHAHGAAVAHGDLKPENVLLTDSHAVVVDTGVVDAVHRSSRGGERGGATEVLCTSAYVAPERRDGGGAGPRDDMYAVGVLVHEMLTGRTPAPEEDQLDEIRAVPAWLLELVRRCLAADPEARWPDAATALPSTNRASWS